jgi:Zn-dependent M28 family amino/carboxypeptidase
LLCLAEYFSQHQPGLDLELIAFGSEEYLPIGDDVYIQRGGEGLFPSLLAAINVDGIGCKLGVNAITMFTESPAFRQQVEEITASYPGVIWTDPWPESNHSTFAWRGVPSIALTARGGPDLHHLRQDSLDWIDPAQLGETTALVAEIVESLAGRTLAWTRPTEDAHQ